MDDDLHVPMSLVPTSFVPATSQPRRESSRRGCCLSAPELCQCRAEIQQEEPVSRILSCAVIPLGAALPRTLISDLPGGFSVLRRTLQRDVDFAEQLCGTGPAPDAHFAPMRTPSLFGLAPCGVYPARDITAAAVRSYRTFSPLPRREAERSGEPERSLR